MKQHSADLAIAKKIISFFQNKCIIDWLRKNLME